MTRLDKIARLAEKAEAKTAKRARKKEELADHAITALKQLGYARTSLRDIAEMSGVAVGTLHYYFEDKVDLIAFCVRRYKAEFVNDLDVVLTSGPGPGDGEIAERFIKRLALSIRRDAETHRLWYDIRAQAMFDPAFEGVVEEIESALIALVATFLDRIGQDRARAEMIYVLMDAAFRYSLQKFLAGDKDAPAQFETQLAELLGALVTAPS